MASGKGGVGKSFVASNLACLLAQRGKKTILADLDVGGADLHILFGQFQPKYDLGHFLQKKVKHLDDVVLPIDVCENLYMLAGCGDTLNTANPGYAEKQKLQRHIKKLDADIVIVDIGAGVNYHALDFFLMADHHLIVTNPEPTAIFDAYKFIKLAAMRHAASFFLKKSEQAHLMEKTSFASLEELLQALNIANKEEKQMVEQAMRELMPMLIVNKSPQSANSINVDKLKTIVKNFIGNDLYVLGNVPADKKIEQAINNFMPLVLNSPQSSAAKALKITAHKLTQKIYH